MNEETAFRELLTSNNVTEPRNLFTLAY